MSALLIRAAIAALAFLVWPACSSEAQADMADVLVFTAIPDHNETELREKYAPVASYLSEKLGVEVRYLHSTSYADSVELFKNGDVQLAWFGGYTGVQARREVEGARAIAQGAVDPKYKSYFIAHVDTGLAPVGGGGGVDPFLRHPSAMHPWVQGHLPTYQQGMFQKPCSPPPPRKRFSR